MTVVFIANEKRTADASRMYRCVNQAIQLSKYASWNTYIYDQFNIDFDLIKRSQVLIFQRCVLTNELMRAYQIARKSGCMILTDFDDLIFIPELMRQSGGVRSKVITNLQSTMNTSKDRFAVIPLSDYTLVSTKELFNQIEKIGGKPLLSKNAINDIEVKGIDKSKKRKLNKLLYMSGTRTHNADFMLAYHGVVKFLKKHADVQLNILGEVDVPVEIQEMHNVYLHPKIPYHELFHFVSDHDLLLVPLENTIFNDAKSSLKFYEAGYVSVPVLSSPVAEFADDIQDGVNGFLVQDNNWFEKLEAIYGNKEQLTSVKRSCHSHVLENYTVSSRGVYLADLIQKLWTDHRERDNISQ